MKKSIMMIALAGALGMTSCSDSFEPSVDFGDKTYINDYGKLVDAVNNLNATLSERLGALNTLLEAGLYDIKVAIDENTGAIKLQTTALKDGLGELNTTFLNGFTALNTTLNSNGEKIVNAIGAQGDLIALHMDKNGELISTQIKGSTADLIATLKDNNKGLEDKLAAINTSISTGLTELNASTSAIGSELKVTNTKLDAMNGHLGNLDADLQAQTVKIGELSQNVLDGFTTLNKTQQENGEKVVSAINKNGEVISAQIKSTGEVLEAQMKTSTTAVIDALNSDFNTLGTKIDAFNAAVDAGLVNISEKINNVDGSIKLQTKAIEGVDGSVKAQTEKIAELSKEFLGEFQAVNSNLGTINTSLGTINTSMGEVKSAIETMDKNLGVKFDAQNAELKNIVTKINDNTLAINKMSEDLGAELKSLNESIIAQGGKLVTAINDKGQLIVEAINAQGEVLKTISTGINTVSTKLDGINASLASMDTKLTTLNGNIVALNTSLGTINENIKTLATMIEEGDKNITDAIKDLKKYSNGVIYDDADINTDGTYDATYVTPEVWGSMDDAAKNALGNTLETIEANPSGVQANSFTVGDSHENLLGAKDHSNPITNPGHIKWIKTGDSGKQIVISATLVKDGVTLFKVVKVLTYSTFTTQVSSKTEGEYVQCGYPHTYYVHVKDARGTSWPLDYNSNGNKYVASFGPIKNVRLYLYDEKTGVFCQEPAGRTYSKSEQKGTAETEWTVDDSFYL